jgi:hypothetical protein
MWGSMMVATTVASMAGQSVGAMADLMVAPMAA